MQKLMPIKEWIEKRFTDTHPTPHTVRNWCEQGHLPSKKIGSLWFILIEEELIETGNPLIDNVLKSTVNLGE